MITRKRKSILYSAAAALMLSLGLTGNASALAPTEDDYHLKLLGKFVFFDNISSIDGSVINGDMSCATCHVPSTGGTGGDSRVNFRQVAITGANPATVGSLKPPTNAYASFISPFMSEDLRNNNRDGDGNLIEEDDINCGGATGFCGGNFWNGRSTGFGGDSDVDTTVITDLGDDGVLGTADDETQQVVITNGTHVIAPDVIPASRSSYLTYLGPTADQAVNPFPNTVEQNVPDRGIADHGLPGAQAVCERVLTQPYGALYTLAWGEPIACYGSDVAISFQRIAIALAAYQASSEVNSFSSKRDMALANDADKLFPLDGFTDQENYGHDLFYGSNESGLNGGPGADPAKGARCNICHLSDRAKGDGTGEKERYADDGYHNIGTPKNHELTNPEPGLAGLAGLTGDPAHLGNRKAPTLRNVDKRPNARFVKAYAANGWFKSLESIVHFYNTASLGNCVVTDVELCDGRRDVVYENTTAATFGITRCSPSVKTERMAKRYNCWPAPEFAGVPPGFIIGDLGLNAEDEAAMVAYLKTLTDLETAEPPTEAELYSALGGAPPTMTATTTTTTATPVRIYRSRQ